MLPDKSLAEVLRSGIVIWPDTGWEHMLMNGPLRLRLDQGRREAVAERYEQARSAVERTNCQVVLLADEGRSLSEIGWLVRRGREQVRTMLHRFQSDGVAGLVPRPRTS